MPPSEVGPNSQVDFVVIGQNVAPSTVAEIEMYRIRRITQD
jgi:BRCT domain type II-containing protein